MVLHSTENKEDTA